MKRAKRAPPCRRLLTAACCALLSLAALAVDAAATASRGYDRGLELEEWQKQLAANYSFTTSDWPPGSSCPPSRHLQEVVSRWSRSPWRIEPAGRLVFSAVVDTSYLPFAHMFVSSLEHLHYEKTDVLLLCTSEACFDWCSLHGLFCMFQHNEKCKDSKRCHVSSVKMGAISALLHWGYTLFFFDLDVYLRRDPLLSAPVDTSPNAALISMWDAPPGSRRGQHANFGLFLIRPCNETLGMFRAMEAAYAATAEWDQGLYNKFMLASAATFDADEYLNWALKSWDPGNVTAVHMTCVEGAYTKHFLARTVFGRFANADFYTEPGRRTVSADYTSVHNLSLQTKAAWINVLVNISLQTKRWVRVTGGGTSEIVPSTFSADRLAKEGVQMAEASFWDSVQALQPARVVTRKHLQVRGPLDLAPATLLAATEDDLEVTIAGSALEGDAWLTGARPLDTSFLCKFAHTSKGKAWCLVQCDGVHFRR